MATQPLTSAAAGAASKPESSTNNSAASAAAAAAAAPADQLDRSNSGSDNNSPKKQQQAKKVSFGPPPSRQGSSLSQDVAIRHTPQAFSHFTYSFSMGAALCVDIQGVGDLYTDPQIHTLDGQGYGKRGWSCRGDSNAVRAHRDDNPTYRREYLKRILVEASTHSNSSGHRMMPSVLCRNTLCCAVLWAVPCAEHATPGDGNLGLRGMALFFRTHECNLLCSRLKLAPFERCATDVAAQVRAERGRQHSVQLKLLYQIEATKLLYLADGGWL